MTVAPRHYEHHAIAFDENVQNAGLIDCDHNGCTVTSNWLDHYKKMEATAGTIAADANIWQVSADAFHISYEVKIHFETMLDAENGP